MGKSARRVGRCGGGDAGVHFCYVVLIGDEGARAVADIPAARRKLNEMRFFLGHMEGQATRPTQHDPRELVEFGYYLSAFLHAGGDVISLLLEGNGDHVWDALLTGERKLIDSMTIAQQLHLTGADIPYGTVLVPITVLHPQRLGGSVVTTTQIQGWAEGGSVPKIAVLAPQFVDADGTTEGVIPRCRRYVQMLEAVVNASE